MGRLLHAENPFAQPVNYEEAKSYISDCTNRIIRFLSIHHVGIIGERDFLLVFMSASNRGNRVAINWFSRSEED